MCMVIAAIALNVSNISTVDSTNNVKRAQAQITAEHYLEQYLSTFPTDPKTGRTNYDDLKKLAVGDEEKASVISISVDASDGSIGKGANISSGTLDQTAAFGGNCNIYVYKLDANGIVVKSVASYDDQQGMASAYFYGEVPNVDLNKNAVETCGTYTTTEYAAAVAGDVLLELADPTSVTSFHNSNGSYYSNFYTNANLLLAKNTPVYFGDTLAIPGVRLSNAPTITAVGNIFLDQLNMSTTVGKTDGNGNTTTYTGTSGTTYNRKDLFNKNGYINSDAKVFLTRGGNKIGDSTNPIDIYCRGMVIGVIPDCYKSDPGFKTKYDSWKSDITNKFSGGTFEKGDVSSIYGNIYSYKAKADDPYTDGTVIINSNNTTTIHGDLCVDGDLVIYSNLSCDGGIYVTGTVYTIGSGTNWTCYYPKSDGSGGVEKKQKSAGDSIESTIPQNKRSNKPSMKYAPGLFNWEDKEKRNPEIVLPSTYKEKSPNNMFADNNEDSKFFKDRFNEALKVTLADKIPSGSTMVPVCPEYNASQGDKSLVRMKDYSYVTINASCRLTPQQVGDTSFASDINGTNDCGIKYYVNVQDKDIWILLPVVNGATSNTIWANFRVRNANNGHHCYFVFYNYENGKPADYYTNPTTMTTAATNAGKFYTSTTNNTVYFPAPQKGEVVKDGIKFASTTFSSSFAAGLEDKDGDCNMVMLVPDGFKTDFGHSGGGAEYSNPFQMIVYGPNADFVYNSKAGNVKFYGQVKVNSYKVTGNADTPFRYNELSKDSILHKYLTKANKDVGNVYFQYYIRHK